MGLFWDYGIILRSLRYQEIILGLLGLLGLLRLLGFFWDYLGLLSTMYDIISTYLPLGKNVGFYALQAFFLEKTLNLLSGIRSSLCWPQLPRSTFVRIPLFALKVLFFSPGAS